MGIIMNIDKMGKSGYRRKKSSALTRQLKAERATRGKEQRIISQKFKNNGYKRL